MNELLEPLIDFSDALPEGAKASIKTVQENILKEIESRDKNIAQLSQQVDDLKHQLDWFKRQVFGETSEKRDMSDNPFQSTIAELLVDLPALPEPREEAKETITYQRGKAKKNGLEESPEDSGLRFNEDVPIHEIQITPPELEGDNKDDYEVIRYQNSFRLSQRPGSYVVLKYIRPVLKRKSTQALITTPAPTNVIDKSVADVSFLVGMLIDKFLYHLPLYRQHQRLAQCGVVLARSTLTNLSNRAIELLRAIYDAQLSSVLQSKVLAIDETPTKAGRAKKGKMKSAYYWPLFGDHSEICFTFSQSRGIQHLWNELGEFNGTILSDGYCAYKHYVQACEEAKHAQCWAHCRRKFDEAIKDEPEACAIALEYIGRLYKVEKRIRESALKKAAALKMRQDYSAPIVESLMTWCYEQSVRIDLTPKSPFYKAIGYLKNSEHALRRFLNDADVAIDTNHVERALRVVPMGKKNWLFSWTEVGAELVGIIQSLIVTCRLQDINPYDYLVDVLQRIDRHPASKVEELTPRLWKEKFASNPLRSDLYYQDRKMREETR